MARKDLIDARTAQLISGFGRYVKVYDDRVPFTGEQLTAHRATIALRHQAGSVRAAAEDERFVASLRQTLLAWGIGRRASRLVPEDQFAAALRAAVPRIEPLEALTIDAPDLPNDLPDQLWQLIDSLGVVENKAKLVAGTKTLHHLVPDLVPPMDREWTGLFFRFHLPEWQDPQGQRRILGIACTQFATVARRVRPGEYATGQRWRTSRTKILDNALIGFCKAELGSQPQPAEEAANQVSFDVPGYPPAKDSGTSIFNAAHRHGPRVHSLLEAAQQASAAQEFTAIAHGRVGLDVVLHTPAGQKRSDAINYLGGIADVLEHKELRSDLEHLGALASMWLYRNDSQITETSYREIAADEAGYTVTVRSISG
ncbi:MAG: hypothetical protein M3Y33_01980 [Actinomycetota bacterium]|nr:hypothetical protein [Actinomycetota bacterium]